MVATAHLRVNACSPIRTFTLVVGYLMASIPTPLIRTVPVLVKFLGMASSLTMENVAPVSSRISDTVLPSSCPCRSGRAWAFVSVWWVTLFTFCGQSVDVWPEPPHVWHFPGVSLLSGLGFPPSPPPCLCQFFHLLWPYPVVGCSTDGVMVGVAALPVSLL